VTARKKVTSLLSGSPHPGPLPQWGEGDIEDIFNVLPLEGGGLRRG